MIAYCLANRRNRFAEKNIFGENQLNVDLFSKEWVKSNHGATKKTDKLSENNIYIMFTFQETDFAFIT